MNFLLKTLLILSPLLTLSACNNVENGSQALAAETPTTINLGALPPDAGRQFVNLVSVTIKPELLEEFLTVLKPYAELTRQEEGVIRYDIHQSPHDPTVIDIYEVYRDTAARVVHNNAEHRNTFFAKVGERQYFRVPAVSKVLYLIDPMTATP
jgi:quinol monooxygenase YgiN